MKYILLAMAILLGGCSNRPPHPLQPSTVIRPRRFDDEIETFTVSHDGWKFVVFYGLNGRMQVVLHPDSQLDLADFARENAAKAQ